ncbi:MAG: AbrB/MazE/SpoVT family DNA-binding domain-containing protein, partial [Candidatus Omnitrophica bacterium]|nr:AbrB/MazE/SpoVT family DNA-binding domain-containing protein [Candidatus Omnitrophota bacterium]
KEFVRYPCFRNKEDFPMMIAQAKLTAKRQITLPIRIMRKLGVHPGDTIAFEEKDDHVELQSMTGKLSALDLIGQYPELSVKKIKPKDIQRIRRQAFSEKAKKLK